VNKNNLNARFLNALRESYIAYEKYGSRSNKKLRPLHQWLANEMQNVLKRKYIIQSLAKGSSGREKQVSGKYYIKTVDISLSRDDHARTDNSPLAVISMKFVTSNFQQNANNYFEHLMGETANIRRRGVIFGHFMVLPNKIPYHAKDESFKKWEYIKSHHLRKYVNLEQDNDYPHKPDVMGISLISLPDNILDDSSKVEFANLAETKLDDDIKNALKKQFSVSSFIDNMKNLIEPKDDR